MLMELLLTAKEQASTMPSLLLVKLRKMNGLLEIHGAKVGGTMDISRWDMEILAEFVLMLSYQSLIYKMGKLNLMIQSKINKPKKKKIVDSFL